MIEFYGVIFRATWRSQVVLIALSLAVAGLAAVPLKYQKDIINGLGAGLDPDTLLWLGIEMAAFILLSLALKWALNFRAGLVGEWAIRRIRRLTCEGEFPSREQDGPVGKGTLAAMISAESENVGKFVGGAVAEPVLQMGTLVSVIGYIAATQPRLGLVVLMIVLPQAAIVLLTQARINRLVRERVLILRRTVNHITYGELAEIRQEVYDDFDRIYEARCRIFIWKLSTKFVLSAFNGVGLVTVLIFGGWLVIQGRSDVGIVVAATVGLQRIQQPWRLVISFYRNLSAVRVQFELMRSAIEHLREGNTGPAASNSGS
ncbi:MAG: ABC transporter transmembrane domain-containing protein [Alphaproteobacteria bacterium]